jgi:hypothetical protein
MKLPTSANPLTSGLTRTFRGLRTGDPQLILMGAAFLALAWLRSRPSGRELIYEHTLNVGESVEVKFTEPA